MKCLQLCSSVAMEVGGSVEMMLLLFSQVQIIPVICISSIFSEAWGFMEASEATEAFGYFNVPFTLTLAPTRMEFQASFLSDVL